MCNPTSRLRREECDGGSSNGYVDSGVSIGEPSMTPSEEEETRSLLSGRVEKDAVSLDPSFRNGPSSSSLSSAPSPPTPSPCSRSDTGFGSSVLDSLPESQQVMILGFLLFLFFGMHNVLQEAIVNLLSASSTMSSDGNGKADGTIMLGYTEVCGVLVFSYLERVFVAGEPGLERRAPLSSYPLLTGCLFLSSSLCNMSLSYINFPTKVVFRSCKLVPTMIIATIVNKKRFAGYEYACALVLCTGLVLFALADYRLDPMTFDPTGLTLVTGSVVADAILPNAQERLFRTGCSRLEVTVFSNLFSFLAMTVATVASGSLPKFAWLLVADQRIAVYVGVYAVLSYVSISCYMTLVKRFGGVTAVLLTTARKAMTLILSFLLFPKGFSWLYVYGSIMVLGAVMIVSICKKLKGRDNHNGETSKSAAPSPSGDIEKGGDSDCNGTRTPSTMSVRSSSSSVSSNSSGSSAGAPPTQAVDVIINISNRAYL